MKKLTAIVLAALALAATTTTAQTPFSIGGYIETYYSYDFSRPTSGDKPLAFNHSRHNEFAVNLALLDLRYSDSDVRARVALQTGTYPASNYAAEPILLQSIHEASAGFRIAEGVWVEAGVLGSHIGMESAIGRDNWTLTRSLAAEYSPYYQAGVRIEAVLSPEWTVRALALNGWQNIRETNNGKAVGAQVQFFPSQDITLNWSAFAGDETPDSSEGSTRIFNDFYAQFALAPALKLAVLFDIGVQAASGTDESTVWHTAALLLRCDVSPAVSIAARGEYFSDSNGVLMPAAELVSGSLGVDWRPTDKVTARIEGRVYNSKESIFSTPSGAKKLNGVFTTSLGFTF